MGRDVLEVPYYNQGDGIINEDNHNILQTNKVTENRVEYGTVAQWPVVQ